MVAMTETRQMTRPDVLPVDGSMKLARPVTPMANLTNYGGDPIFALASASVFACLGVSFGVFLRTKDKAYKTLVGSYLISGALSGVNEPLIYGVIMRPL